MAELWDPETGKVYALTATRESDDRTTIDLSFGPAQSWFVVFRDQPSALARQDDPFSQPMEVMEIKGPWKLRFDPEWGSDREFDLASLASWSEHPDPLVKYYSGTGTYRTTFELETEALAEAVTHWLDLGQVDVVARVTLNESKKQGSFRKSLHLSGLPPALPNYH